MQRDEQGNSQQQNRQWNDEMKICDHRLSGSTKAHVLLILLWMPLDHKMSRSAASVQK